MQDVAAPSGNYPVGTWVSFTVATPSGTFTWPPEPYGWGSAVVKVRSGSSKQSQKAAGRSKAKTKKNGPDSLKLTIEMIFVRARWEGARGAGAVLAALDPNNENGAGGPFDLVAADFTRRGGKSIDITSIGEVAWRGHIGTCTIEAEEWVPEPPKAEDGQGTKDPEKSEEYVPDADAGDIGNNSTLIARTGLAAAFTAQANVVAVNAQQNVVVQRIAKRGFDGPNKPTSKP